MPLSRQLSQVLVAFTIELDNRWEQQMAESGAGRRFAVSLVMWSNVMRFVGEEGVTVRELYALARISKSSFHASLAGLKRWGYVAVEPHAEAVRPIRIDPGAVVRPTSDGRMARKAWKPLPGEIEKAWRERFGEIEIDALREALSALAGMLDYESPHYLPVVSYADGMRAGVADIEREPATRLDAAGVARLDLPALLSAVLLALTLEFERESNLSLAISGNALRVLDEQPVPVRDLPGLSGVSKEAIAASVGFLARHGYVVVEPDRAAARGKAVRLTTAGRQARDAYGRLLRAVEKRWQSRYGKEEMHKLRESLETIVNRRDGDRSTLSRGLMPQPKGWRARKPYLTQTEAVLRDPNRALPHYPMVLHRGGWPDGS